jgi:hypothetical protein
MEKKACHWPHLGLILRPPSSQGFLSGHIFVDGNAFSVKAKIPTGGGVGYLAGLFLGSVLEKG